MNLEWQQVVSVSMVSIAAVYLGYRVCTVIAGKRSDCGTGECKTCPDTETFRVQSQPFVSIDQLTDTTDSKRRSNDSI